MARLQIAAFAFIFLLLGSMSYYGYYANQELANRNDALAFQVAILQANLTRLTATLAATQANLTAAVGSQAVFAEQAGQFQMSLAQQGLQQTTTSQQLAAAQTELLDDASELSNLSARLATIQAWNVTAIQEATTEIQNVTARVIALEATLNQALPSVFLRTQGTALASYVAGDANMTYLRLTEIGPGSIVESALGSLAFNASVAGASAQWYAVGNTAASDLNHWTWPLVLENSPGGTEAIEFEDAGGVQEAATVHDGIRYVANIKWDTTVPHLFQIVVVTPGALVNFYIDGKMVATITQGVPNVGFLLYGAEIKQTGPNTMGVAMLDVYGGMIGYQ